MNYCLLNSEENIIFKSVDEKFYRLYDKIQVYAVNNEKTISDCQIIKKAYEMAKYLHRDVKRKSGEMYIWHPYRVFEKLFNHGIIDINILCASLLHDTVEDTEYTLERINNDFNSDIKIYVEMLTKIEPSTDITDGLTKKEAQFMTDEQYIEIGQNNPSAMLIKFADRWDNLHTCTHMSEQSIKKNIAHTKSILIPIAKKIGCFSFAEELEDSCFLASKPDLYKNISASLKNYFDSSKKQINKTISEIVKLFEGEIVVNPNFITPYPYVVYNDIKKTFKGEIQTKKNLFSFYQYKPYVFLKLEIPDIMKEKIYSYFVVNVLPKLQSKNISVTGEGSYISYDNYSIVYWHAEDYYYNHFRFLVGKKSDYDALYRGNPDINHTKIYIGSIRDEGKKVQIYTKDGNPFTVEKGATVLDYAFIINTMMGACYKEAYVNGNKVELDYVLQNKDQVYIVKDKVVKASVSWFRYLETKTARNRLISFIEKKYILKEKD